MQAENDKLKQKLEKENSFATKGTILRSKANFYECGEKNTKYFFNLEKRNGRMKVTKRLINESGQTITRAKEVLEEQASFYCKLYTEDPNIFFEI